jgi:hypothetical protein
MGWGAVAEKESNAFGSTRFVPTMPGNKPDPPFKKWCCPWITTSVWLCKNIFPKLPDWATNNWL